MILPNDNITRASNTILLYFENAHPRRNLLRKQRGVYEARYLPETMAREFQALYHHITEKVS